jgi:hypothetical protein
MSKLDIRPNELAVKTKWGWQNSVTGELLVSAPGYFKDVEADSDKPNTKSITAKPKDTKKPKKPKNQQKPKEEVTQVETDPNSGNDAPPAPPEHTEEL